MVGDQAAGLRALAEGHIAAETRQPTLPHQRNMRIIAVSSGKGGVGKTNITINMAIALAELGKQVVVLDGDLGLANIDVVCGIAPKYTLEDVILNGRTLSDILIEGPRGIKILPGGSGQLLANLDPIRLQLVLDRLQYLEDVADILLIDTGAGISRHVTQLLEGADEVVVVATPEPTSITDAYGLVKTLLAERKDWQIGVLVNRAKNRDEADATFTRFAAAVQRFLHFNVNYFGVVFEDYFVTKSVMRQTPFVVGFPKAPASQCVMNLARQLVGNMNKSETPGRGIRGLLQGLIVKFSNQN